MNVRPCYLSILLSMKCFHPTGLQLKQIGSTVLILLIWATGSAQKKEPFYQLIENKFPTSTNIFQSLVDSRGYSWFCSTGGVSKYDGYTAENFGKDEGLGDRIILRLFEDYMGRIWAYSSAGNLFYLEGREFRPFEFNKELSDLIKGDKLSSFYLDHSGTLHIGHYTKGYFTVSPEGLIEEQIIADSSNFGIGLIMLDDTIPFCFSLLRMALGHRLRGNVTFYNKDLSVKDQFQIYNATEEFEHYAYTLRFIQRQNGGYLLSYDDRLVEMDSSGKLLSVLKQRGRIVWIFEGHDQAIYVGMSGHGLNRITQNQDGEDLSEYWFEEDHVSSISQDEEGGLWVTSVVEAPKYIPHLELKQYAKFLDTDDYIRCVAHGRFEEKYYATRAAKLIWERNGKASAHFPINANGNALLGTISTMMFDTASNLLWIGGTKDHDHVVTFDGKEFRLLPGLDIERDMGQIRVLSVDEFRDCIWIGTSGYLHKVVDERIVEQIQLGTGPIRKVLPTRNEIYVGTAEGLIVYKPGLDHTINLIQDSLLNTHVFDMEFFDGELWLGTLKHHLIRYDTALKTVSQMVPIQSEVYDIQVVNDQMWFKSSRGLVRTTLADGQLLSETFDLSYRMGPRSTNWLLISSKEIIIAQAERIFQLNKVDFPQPKSRFPIYIEEVRINNTDTTFSSTYNLDFDQNFITLRYSAVSNKYGDNIMYRYMLKGVDRRWVETRERKVQYTTLPPGDYTFQLFARGMYDDWPAEPLEMRFIISSPYWKSWWFILLCSFSILSLCTGLIWYRLQQLSIRSELQIALAQSQHRALSAQLKPHFLFNAMNSIHNYIRKNDKEKSSEYLLRFSKFIRQILSNSSETIVSIDEELRLVKMYLEVEQMRFGDKLKYEIEVDPSIDISMQKIPVQLIQPYVENAIWHGLMHKEEPGTVRIKLQLKGDNLVCVIEDDGIGRKAAQSFAKKQSDHRSVGMILNRDRLTLMQSIFKRPFELQVIDMENEQGVGIGTKVLLTIPIIDEK